MRRVKAAPKHGLLYEVKYEKNVVYVFGTIHAGKEAFYPLNLETLRAVIGSAVLAVEANTLDQPNVTRQVTELAMLPPPSTIDRYVTPALMSKVTKLLEEYQYSKEQALRMKPWMLANTLAALEGKRAGYDFAWASEAFLVGLANARRIQVVELEGLSLQFKLFNELTADEQLTYLQETVDAIDTGAVAKRTAALADAWASADAGALGKISQEFHESQGTFGRFFSSKMLDGRNAPIAARIDEYLRSGKRHFVAVGVLHLLGEKNVIELLRERGYSVREL